MEKLAQNMSRIRLDVAPDPEDIVLGDIISQSNSRLWVVFATVVVLIVITVLLIVRARKMNKKARQEVKAKSINANIK